MTESAILRELQAMARMISPWITTAEMMARYDCTAKTLAAMERRGEIPYRVNGRWSREQVIAWEAEAISPKTPHE